MRAPGRQACKTTADLPGVSLDGPSMRLISLITRTLAAALPPLESNGNYSLTVKTLTLITL